MQEGVARHIVAAHVLMLCDPALCSFHPHGSCGLASDRTQAERFEDFVTVIVSGDRSAAAQLLDASPLLAKERRSWCQSAGFQAALL